MKTCKIENCESKYYALGFCGKHHYRFKKYGDSLKLSAPYNHGQTCSVEGCNEKYHALGFCDNHYWKFRKYGDPLYVHNPAEYHSDICSIPDCGKKRISRGYCDKHYRKYKLYGDPLYINPRYLRSDICSIPDCNNNQIAKGFCKKHYYRFNKYGSPDIVYPKSGPKKHGMCGTPEYDTWCHMKSRCYNKNNLDYHRYGGRGIKICDRWLHSFDNFIADMGCKPFEGLEIDRTNNDGNYEPSNCRWVTHKQNCQNRGSKKISSNSLA